MFKNPLLYVIIVQYTCFLLKYLYLFKNILLVFQISASYFFPNAVKYVRPTYGNKEAPATLSLLNTIKTKWTQSLWICVRAV